MCQCLYVDVSSGIDYNSRCLHSDTGKYKLEINESKAIAAGIIALKRDFLPGSRPVMRLVSLLLESGKPLTQRLASCFCCLGVWLLPTWFTNCWIRCWFFWAINPNRLGLTLSIWIFCLILIESPDDFLTKNELFLTESHRWFCSGSFHRYTWFKNFAAVLSGIGNIGHVASLRHSAHREQSPTAHPAACGEMSALF